MTPASSSVSPEVEKINKLEPGSDDSGQEPHDDKGTHNIRKGTNDDEIEVDQKELESTRRAELQAKIRLDIDQLFERIMMETGSSANRGTARGAKLVLDAEAAVARRIRESLREKKTAKAKAVEEPRRNEISFEQQIRNLQAMLENSRRTKLRDDDKDNEGHERRI